MTAVSFKTDRLARLFPDVYAAREGASLLHRLLDAVGAELVDADEAVKRLLKSHWIDHAEGDALDGLAATFGVGRRRLPDGSLEEDERFRTRLKALVPYFTGGGTIKAVTGAVRSALGLPFDLDLFRRELSTPTSDPARDQALIEGLETLVRVEEFSPRHERILSGSTVEAADAAQVTLDVGFASTADVHPRVEWTFQRGGGRRLSVQRLDTGEGIRSKDALRVDPGATLLLTAAAGGGLQARLGGADVSDQFTAWDGTSPPRWPVLPGHPTQWRFRAAAALFDVSAFDEPEGFDLPAFRVRFEWTGRQPLTFDVIVPYFLKAAVQELEERTGHPGRLFLYEGLPLDTIQQVVDQTRAAGVRGEVHFSLNLTEDHRVRERLTGHLVHAARERQDMDEDWSIGNLTALDERQDMVDTLALGGVFDVSTFDTSFGFH